LEKRDAENVELNSKELERLFELFHTYREMDTETRDAWLCEACGGDLSLQRRVEALIREGASADGFLSSPMAFVTRSFSFVIAEGQRFGRYTITGFVGRGGMGEVWKAHDEELDRTVALKFMASGFAVDTLTREARMASALNHPGIVIVHDVIVWEGTPILVMELVTGEPLSRFCDGLIPLGELTSVAAQVSSALATAHANGIIHGDLKPDNIICRADHFAKVLDFGLAQKENEAAGAIAGTPAYMSPEQARREAISTASDVYSLGLVFYELATGRRPYGRQSIEEIGNRRAGPPRASSLRPGLSRTLDRLIDSMLEPEPVRRVSMPKVAEQLKDLTGSSPPYRVWQVGGLAAVTAAIVTALVSLWPYAGSLRNRFGYPRSEFDLSRMTIRPLASQRGLEDNPSISPDGLWVSCLYRARPSDRPQMQVHSMQGGPPIVIDTPGLMVEGPAAWSPDSSELLFSAREGAREHSIYRVSRKGGFLRPVFKCRPRGDPGCELDWSPDGRTLVIADRWPGNSELYVLDLASGRRRDLIQPTDPYVKRPRFSPDGKWIAYLKQVLMTSDDLYLIAAAGGEPRRITDNPWYLRSLTWSTDGRSLMAVSSRQTNKLQVWQFPLHGREPYPVGELDANRGSDLSLARKKRALTWVRDLNANSLWRMPADQSDATPEPLVNSAALDIDAEWSSNGRMVFRSDRSGTNELWIANADGTGVRQATRFRGPFVGDPHWSPDGRSIAFTSHLDGNPDIFVMRCDQDGADCGQPRQFTRTPASDANPTWSGDGRWIYFSSSRSGKFEVWRMPADGSAEPQRITWNEGYLARESKDGKWLYYSKLWPSAGFWRIALPAHGPGQPETPIILKVPGMAGATWALGGRELFYYPSTDDPEIPFPAVRAVDLETGRTRDLPLDNVRLSRGLSLSPDERWLLRSQIDRAQTLVMIAE
jgi:eukaryotic-like serine/threonine-protein kinase